MNKGLLGLIVLILTFLVYRLNKVGENGQLGKVKSMRPPKLRIVYSKKIKDADRPKIGSSNEAAEVLKELWTSQMEVREEFVVLHLDKSNRVLGYQLLSKGGISGTVVDVRLVYAAALKTLASGIILAHNHPSGNTKPSSADIQITKKIKEAGQIHDITLVDHIILTKDSYTSLADEALI